MNKRVCIDLDTKIYSSLEKRAKKELFTVKELCEDILRRSVVSGKRLSLISGTGDDKFIEYFSRNQYRKRKKKNKK